MVQYNYEISDIEIQDRGSRKVAVGGIIVSPWYDPGEGLSKVILGKGDNPYMSLMKVGTTPDATVFLAESGRSSNPELNKADIHQIGELIVYLAEHLGDVMDIYNYNHFPFPHPLDIT